MSDESDSGRGTMAVKVADTRIRKESKDHSVIIEEQQDDMDEMMDTVGDLNNNLDKDNAVHRHSSAFVETTA